MTTNRNKKVQHLLDKAEKKSFLLLVCQMILVALLEFSGIALVLPFIRFAGNQMSFEKLPSFFSSWLGLQDHKTFLIYAGISIFILIVLSTVMKVYLSWKEQKFVWNLSHKLTVQQHKNILSQPYSFFIEKNSSEIIANLIVETSTTVRGILLPIAQIISNSVVAILFLALITFLHPKISLILIVVGGFIGFIMITLLNKKLISLGKERLLLERSRFLQLKESIIGIKTVKTNRKENFFLSRFEKISESYSNIKPFVNTVNSVPRKALDIVLFGGVVILVTIFIIRGDNVSLILPTLTFYVLVGFKLMPTFQNIINAVITIRFSWPSLKAVFEGLEKQSVIKKETVDPLIFEDKISITNCTFAHQEKEYILKDVSLEIIKSQKVGIVGYSGSGKTTLVEILSGLLIPNEGYISVDNEKITKDNITGLINITSFIPQDVFFFDDTMLSNITLQDDKEEVDYEKIESLLELLKLSSFVMNLPNGLKTKVGEFGIKVSGGQKQRLGFARALYKDPQILILDESTSALDYITEKELLENLRKKLPNLTIIKVAHRLKSVQDCDNIYFLDQGKIIAEGTFDDVIKNNDLFREMVSAGTI